MTDFELQKRVFDKISECYKVYPNANRPHYVKFDKRGKVAGTANYGRMELNFNMALLRQNPDEFIGQTVPHEVAHLITDWIWNGTAKPHGKEWKKVMRNLGCKPKRCHSYDTENSGGYEKTKYHYRCSKCGADIFVGPTRHKRQQKHRNMTGNTYYRHNCGGGIRYVKNMGRVSYQDARKKA